MLSCHTHKRLLFAAQSGTIFSGAFLLAFGVASLFMLPDNSQAAVVPISCGLPHTLSTCLSINVSSPSLEIEMPSVSADGAYAYGANTVNVKTNAPAYNLALSTNSAAAASQRLQNSADASFIAPTTGALGSLSPLGSNTWGFTSAANPTANASIWSAVPTNASPAVLVSNSSANDAAGANTSIYYGVKIDHGQTSGEYQGTVLYSATVTPFGAPTVSGVSPGYGAASGGTVLTISGTNFYDTIPTTGVKVGGVNCASFTVNSPTSITCTTPAGGAGAKDVTVATENGTVTKTGAYTYIPAPTVTSRTPSTGVVNGNTVTITGTNFSPALGTHTVSDNSSYTTCTINSTTNITCPVSGIPDNTTGSVTITITTTGGAIATGFSYSQPHTAPTITGINNTVSTNYGTTAGGVGVATDKNANCKWNLGSDFTYATQGTAFMYEQGTMGPYTWATGFTAGTNTVYVRCANANDSTKVSTASTTTAIISSISPGPTDPGTTLGAMQSLTNANCPATRGTAYDARNNQIYYVQKIAGLCWMETNLRYAGGGSYDPSWGWSDDRKTISTAGATTTNGTPYYFDPGGSTNYTDTTSTWGFLGYLYNWCASMGGQPNACDDISTTGFNTNISICPSRWRLPTSNGGDFTTLNNAINSGSTASDAGLLNNFLAVYSGGYSGVLMAKGTGYLQSSTAAAGTNAYGLSFHSGGVGPTSFLGKRYAYAVRCVLD